LKYVFLRFGNPYTPTDYVPVSRVIDREHTSPLGVNVSNEYDQCDISG